MANGSGVDNIDYLASRELLYVAAGRAARLTIARVDDRGGLEPLATARTSPGCRVVVAEARGNAYVGDPARGRLLVYSNPP